MWEPRYQEEAIKDVKRKRTHEETVAERLTQEFVKKMQATDFSSQDPQTTGAMVQQFVQDMVAATTPSTAGYVPAASSEEFVARCKAFTEAIRDAKDPESTWRAFDRLAGR